MSKGEPELVYVEGAFAFFQRDHKKAWGDDWDDRPYEHNAERPYGQSIVVMYDNREVWDDGCTPVYPCSYHINSNYSVEDINRRKLIPWIVVQAGPIMAGATMGEFMTRMMNSGRKTTIIGLEGDE